MEFTSSAEHGHATYHHLLPLSTTHYFPEEIYEDDYMDDYTESIDMESSPSPPERAAHITCDAREYDEINEYAPLTPNEMMYHQAQNKTEGCISLPIFLPRCSPPTITSEYYQAFGKDGYDYYSVAESRAPMKGNLNQRSKELSAMTQTSNPRNTHGIALRPISTLPDMYRSIFKFGVFNAVQSSCFSDVCDKSILWLCLKSHILLSIRLLTLTKTWLRVVKIGLVCGDVSHSLLAPTGSGKTVLFELAIIRMLSLPDNTDRHMKCVYIAPTKALCSERYRDWTTKFDPLGITCSELTGDTIHFGKGVWGDAKKASIIITTGEKWDSLTRNWNDHHQILSSIRLLLVDEVHILNESRGSTLEVVVSRMRTRGSSVRFLFVSATVPNIQDIAAWIGSNGQSNIPAKVFQFGEEFRPCKLTRFVIGVSRPKGQNDFAFSKSLDYKLFMALQQYSMGKPIMVFCSTRKGVFTTAEQLMKDYLEAENGRKSLPWSHPKRNEHSFHDKRLADLASVGIGVHHAGLTLDDRKATETLYLNGTLRVIVATSTLAVGVNLPAHMVVIKGVQTFNNNTSVEYSDLDIMQMLGRAGRPQFDKDGIALIICETELEQKYRTLVQGKTILESTLHTNLAEHLNSEIGLGTITSISTAKTWLRGSFLFQRLQKNPNHYSLGKDDNQTWEERVDELVLQSVEKLRQTQLVINGPRSDQLISTDFGDIMSKLYIRQSTMGLILTLPERLTLREILEMISSSEEFSDTKLRVSEKSALNKLRKHPDIRFELTRVEKTADKVFLLIQAVLGGISLNTPEYKSADSQPQLEAFGIFRHVSRIARAVVEVGVFKQLGGQVKYGLELLRCLTAKAWEDRPIVLRQLEQIGEKSIKVLAEHGIISISHLLNQDALRIEALLNRRSPFGLELLASAQEFPRYSLNITQLGVSSNGGKDPVEIELSIQCGLEQVQNYRPPKFKKSKGYNGDMTVVLTISSDLELFDYRRISTKSLKEKKTFNVTAELSRPSQSINVLITSETIAGLVVQQSYKPALSPQEFPTRNTRPPTTTDIDLVGLEDDPDFWNMDIGEEVLPVVRDLTKPKGDATKLESLGADLCPDKDQNEKDFSSSQNTKSGVLLRSLDRQTQKRMQNGNFECNHSCRDKKKCRHLCCRDGLPEKPKKRPSAEKSIETSRKQQNRIATEATRSKISTSTRRMKDPRLEQLESLHKQSNVSSNLQLSLGHRLKLEPSVELKRKQKPIPDFKLDYSDLKDLDKVNRTGYDPVELEDDEDDLPEAVGISNVDRPRTPPSETSYSNSDIDSLIRAVPLNDELLTVASGCIESEASDRKPLASFNKRKRTTEPNASNKRIRREELENQSQCHEMIRTTHQERAKDAIGVVNKRESLFLSDDTHEVEEDFGCDKPTKVCDWLLGTSLLESDGPSLPSDYLDHDPTPDLTLSTAISNSFKDLGPQEAQHTSLIGKTLPRTDTYEKEKSSDDFAELDAWLNSGAVEIL
ncbi:ATP-dependent DNA helicase MER3 [Termitomyces sp. T112]|nr:ATP-dependent DNA helicase MER3 [Termitomyces sp. T112]